MNKLKTNADGVTVPAPRAANTGTNDGRRSSELIMYETRGGGRVALNRIDSQPGCNNDEYQVAVDSEEVDVNDFDRMLTLFVCESAMTFLGDMEDLIDSLYPPGDRFCIYDEQSGKSLMPGETAYAALEALAHAAWEWKDRMTKSEDEKDEGTKSSQNT